MLVDVVLYYSIIIYTGKTFSGIFITINILFYENFSGDKFFEFILR